MPYAPIGRDIELHYELHGPDEAPVVTFIRGTGADGARWLPQVRAYEDHFRCLIFDNRGVGRSSAPPPPYTVADMAADTLGLLDHLGIDTTHLSGSSLGGAVALHLALDHPGRVRSLQLHSSWLATRGYTEFSLNLLKHLAESGGIELYYEATLPMLFSPYFLASDHQRLQDILATMRANPASIDGLMGQLEANLSHDLHHRAGEISVPTLVTVGALDVVCPTGCSVELAAAIPHAELHVFGRAGHLASMEAADSFNALTLRWLLNDAQAPLP